MTETVLVPPSTAVTVLPDRQTTRRDLQAVYEFQAAVRELFIEGHDYGVIPGTGNKPALLKPGAEKLAKLLHLADRYEVIERVEDWDRPLFRYLIRCRLVDMTTETVVSEGLGECNSMESKYRWRWVWPSDLAQEVRQHLRTLPGRAREVNTRNGKVWQYRVENDDVYSQVNTILKMAKKRALVDAALSAGRLSDLFTQDIEDFADEGIIDGEARDVTPPVRATDSGGGDPAPAAAPPDRAPVTSAGDPLWHRWQALCAEATALGVDPELMGNLSLPVDQDVLITAGKALAAAVEAQKTGPPARDDRLLLARERLSAQAREIGMTTIQLGGLIATQYGEAVGLEALDAAQVQALITLLSTGELAADPPQDELAL